jgi:thioredoxin reductase
MPDFDLGVIGAGAAGLSTAALSAALGLKVALVERAEMGGDCLNRGCVPSKALLAAAHAAASARHAGRFGVRVAEPEIDWPAVRAHIRGAIARIAPTDSEARFRGMGVEVIRASAHFTAPDEIEAGARRITFRRCVIAAGSAPLVPDIEGLGPVPWLTSDTIFELEEKPDHLIILGGGPIGLEMAQAHARRGYASSFLFHATFAPQEGKCANIGWASTEILPVPTSCGGHRRHGNQLVAADAATDRRDGGGRSWHRPDLPGTGHRGGGRAGRAPTARNRAATARPGR